MENMAFVTPTTAHHAFDLYADVNGHDQQHLLYPTHSISPLHHPSNPAYYDAAMPQPQMSCDIKPRLTKEQHDILEAQFQLQNKPSTNTKKSFAEALGVSPDKVNVSP
jgi:hypothetical protein